MKTKKEDSRPATESQFELKYCERCGGLWLRPAGGGQVYCVACARQMAELPPASRELGRATMQPGPRWGVDHCDNEEGDAGEEMDLDAGAEVWHE
jgi:hypothetical protein